MAGSRWYQGWRATMVPDGAVVDQVDASAASLARESGRASDAGALEAGDELDDEPSGRRRRRDKQVMAAPAEGSRCIGETTLVTGTHPCRARDLASPENVHARAAEQAAWRHLRAHGSAWVPLLLPPR